MISWSKWGAHERDAFGGFQIACSIYKQCKNGTRFSLNELLALPDADSRVVVAKKKITSETTAMTLYSRKKKYSECIWMFFGLGRMQASC